MHTSVVFCISFKSKENERKDYFDYFAVLRSQSRKEPHLLVGAGAGAVTRCGSGSNGSGSDNGIKHG
jgi:hypothetical protein